MALEYNGYSYTCGITKFTQAIGNLEKRSPRHSRIIIGHGPFPHSTSHMFEQ